MSSALTSSVASRFESVVGNAFVRTEADALGTYAVDGALPSVAVQPENSEQTAEIVRISVEERLSLIASGAHTSLGIGMPPSRYDVAIDMTRVRGIAHYDAGDLTISVNAGTPLAELANIGRQESIFAAGGSIF